EVVDQIGKGSFGVIRKVKRRMDGRIFARKEMDFSRMSDRDRKQIVAEVNILRNLKHESIVAYEERFVDSQAQTLYIIMEYCGGGDLGEVIKKCRKNNTYLPEDTVWSYFSQMTQALEALHYKDCSANDVVPRAAILHRDLKPENIFLDADDNVKLGDFGLSKQITGQIFASTYVGTPYYMSPEIATNQRYDFKCDVWALGCIAYELCALQPPFDAQNQAELTRKIKQGQVPKLPRGYSNDLGDLIRAMLNLSV
ncbi:kinase-like protein, partial [Ceraceosorus guamensis]